MSWDDKINTNIYDKTFSESKDKRMHKTLWKVKMMLGTYIKDKERHYEVNVMAESLSSSLLLTSISALNTLVM